MKNDTAAIRRITQLASRLDPDILTSLWIVRCASPDYTPAYEQMGIVDLLQGYADAEPAPETPWHRILQASSRDRLPAIAQVLTVILPRSPLADKLERLIPLRASQNAALEELVHVLSGISPKDTSLSHLFLGPRDSTALLPETFDIPSGILHLLLSLLNIQPESQVYDPCYGSGSLLSRALELLSHQEGLFLYAQAPDSASYQAGAIQSYLHRLVLDLGEKPAEALTEDLHADRAFDCILANPPFNYSGWYTDFAPLYDPRWKYGIPPRSNGNFAWLQHVIAHLSPNGCGAVILPNGTLTTQTQSEREIRIRILHSGLVEAIIALPAGMFTSTRIPCCIWLLTGAPRPDAPVLFVDAQQLSLSDAAGEDVLKLTGLITHHRSGLIHEKTAWYAPATLAEIEERDYILSPNFYTLSPGLSLKSLEEGRRQMQASLEALAPKLPAGLYAQLEPWMHRASSLHWRHAPLSQLYSISGGIVKKKEAFGHGTPMADVATVIRHAFLPDILPSRVEATPEEIQKFSVQSGDILMNRSSETIEELACCCTVTESREAVFSGYLKRLRPMDGACPDSCYMAAYFRSAIYRQEITNISPVYTTRSNINMKQLSKVLAYYPDEEMQQQLGSTMLAVSQFRESCFDQTLSSLLDQFTSSLIELFITAPILKVQQQK